MAKPFIGYRSVLREAGVTVTDPGSDSGYPIANVEDLRSVPLWRSSVTTSPINIDIDTGAGGMDADYIGFVNHNLTTLGATVKVMADAASPATTQRLAATAPSTDNVAILQFTAPGAQRYWRVQIAHAAPPFAAKPFIGEMFLGRKTTLNEYLSASFEPFFRDVEAASGEESEGGHFLGVTLRGQQHRGTLSLGGPAGVARADFTADLNAFITNHVDKRYPFLFAVDTDDTDFAVARYIKMTTGGRVRRSAIGGTWQRLTFEFPVETAFMEPVA